MTSRRALVSGLAVLLLVGGATAGFLLGKSDAPTTAEANDSRQEAYRLDFKASYSEAFATANEKGSLAGVKRGMSRGGKAGNKAGDATGAEAAQTELDLIAAEQARLAAEAEAAERAANCGHVLFVDGACPSDAEVQYEEDAESYCGGGDYETAAALGIEC